MRLMDWIRGTAGALVLLLPLLVVVPAHAEGDGAEEAAARTYAREQLIRNAKLSVDPTNRAAGGLDTLKANLRAKRELYQQLALDEYSRALQLLGGSGAKGLIQEAALLYRWLDNIPTTLAEKDPETGLPRVEPPVSPSDPDAYPNLRDAAAKWDRLAEAAAQGDQGEGAAKRWLQPQLLALVNAKELEIRVSKAFLDKRELEVADHVKGLKLEQPPRGLVNDRTVEEKALRAQSLRKEAEAYAVEREAVIVALDRMARAERLLKEDSGRLGFLIDEARRKETAKKERAAKSAEAAKREAERDPDAKDAAKAPDEAPPEPEVSKALAKLQLEEIVDEQQLRLLYLAVRRADLLLRNYDDAIRQVKEEARAAEDAYKLFEAELSRMRRERQLERLAWQASDLKRERVMADEAAKKAPEAERPIWQAYGVALESLAARNRLTREAVAMRRGLEARARPDCAPGELPTTEEGCLPPEPGAPVPAPQSDTAPGPKDDLRRFRNPSKGTIDANYVRDASAMLDHEAWDAELAARHFVAVDDRIQALEGALALVRDTQPLRERFAAATAAAEAALTQVHEAAQKHTTRYTWRQRLRERREKNLATTESKAFTETLRSIDAERAKIAEDIVLFRQYRRSLLGLGTRSFQIRVQRLLDPERLESAYDDVDATVAKTGRWLTLQGEDHAGTFFERNWLMLLACFGVLIASILGVRFGRHALDRMLRTLATRVPELRSEPVTVRAEEAQAKRERAVQEAASKAAEEEALRQVSKEEADRQQKMGEGGYSGGEDA